MSVQSNQYYGYGYFLPYKDAKAALEEKYGEEFSDELDGFYDTYSDSAFNDKVVEVNDCSLIIDGMNGEYVFFGKLFAKSANGSYLNKVVISPVKTKVKNNVKQQLLEVFGREFSVKPQTVVFTHYR